MLKLALLLKTEIICKRCPILEKYRAQTHTEFILQYLQMGMDIHCHSKASFSIVITNFPYVFYRHVIHEFLFGLYSLKSCLAIVSNNKICLFLI